MGEVYDLDDYRRKKSSQSPWHDDERIIAIESAIVRAIVRDTFIHLNANPTDISFPTNFPVVHVIAISDLASHNLSPDDAAWDVRDAVKNITNKDVLVDYIGVMRGESLYMRVLICS
jgi:hypothetical protein